jgi:DNA-binding transcriptional LysR family regulator
MATLRTKNLNLIPILQALLHEESVAKAAEKVSLSQPTMSGALARLRDVLGDPLLYRAGKSMRLTPRAQRLRSQLDQICEDIERLFQPETFDPTTEEHSFVIAAPDFLVVLLGGTLMTRLRKEAPRVRIRFVDVPVDLPNWLDEASIDLAVCGNFGIWPELRVERLYRERIVAVVANDHPLLARTSVTSADLLEFPGLNYATGIAQAKRAGPPLTGIPSLDWVSQVSAGQFVEAVLLATEKPFVARVPQSLAERMGKLLPLTSIELAGDRSEHDNCMFWSAVYDHAPEHVWLRTLVQQSFEALRLRRG